MDIILNNPTPETLERYYENHFLFQTKDFALMCEATEIPWLQFIPNQSLENTEYAGRLYAEIYRLAYFLQSKGLGPHFNVAKIGNKLPYYHIHLVFRTPEDTAWPEPIWCGMPLKQDPKAPQKFLTLLADYNAFESSAKLKT